MRLLREVPAVEIDAWLRYVKWNDVLNGSKHNMIKTFRFARSPDPDEPNLQRVVRAWNHVLVRCLDTLQDVDHKDVLKWWASPKNESASQRPFEIPQNSKSVEKYRAIWANLICYMMRTAPVEEYTDETGTPSNIFKGFI